MWKQTRILLQGAKYPWPDFFIWKDTDALLTSGLIACDRQHGITVFSNLCLARALLSYPSQRCGAMPEIGRLAAYFWQQLACIPIRWAPSHNSTVLTRPGVFISARVIGVTEHSADGRLFLFLYRCQAWVGGVFHSGWGMTGPLRFLHFTEAFSFVFFYPNLCHVRSGKKIGLIFKGTI